MMKTLMKMRIKTLKMMKTLKMRKIRMRMMRMTLTLPPCSWISFPSWNSSSCSFARSHSAGLLPVARP